MSEPSSGTVLVVDDNDANRYVLSRLLLRAGYRVLEAASGAQAIELLAKGPDLAVLDVNLPDIKGTVLARRIKDDPATASILVLNMSASFTRTQDRIEGLESGADGYLTQPLDPPEFLATVKALMRIRRAEDQVRSTNRELEQFAYIASHDLQEPLRMISNYLSLLDRRYAAELDDQARKYIHYAVDGAARMTLLVRDLLSLAQTGSAPLERKEIDAAIPLAAALDNLALKVRESAAMVSAGELPRITADQGLITQVFQNLIANALKFRSERPPEVRVTAVRDGAFQVFSVADNGIGIAPEQQERVFEIFQRLHAIGAYPGSGIGLALCKRIVARHGGTIGVESTPGTGSRFWFTLPA
ncbi:MAG: response regulator [Planctomycetes bacterium]|nr:response regulator [Planctomycetota bacterium]